MNLKEFWKRVVKDGCWTWTGAQAKGKGRVWFEGRLWTPQELAWMAVRGALPPNQTPHPTCGSPLCCHPDHTTLVPKIPGSKQLFAGQPGGAQHPRARLTKEQVLEVRRRIAAGEPQKAVAALFGISQPHASRLARGARWGCLEGTVVEASKQGAQKPNAKLTEKDIPIIRQRVLDGDSFAEIARDLEVGPTTISRVWHGLSWKHVPTEKPSRPRVWEG